MTQSEQHKQYEYKPPLPFTSTGARNLYYTEEMQNWCWEAILKGEANLKAYKGYHIAEDMKHILNEDIVSSDPETKKSYSQGLDGVSSLNIPKEVRINDEIITTLSNVKQYSKYSAPSGIDVDKINLINKLHKAWWYNIGYDNKTGFNQLKEALKYASCGSGYMYFKPKHCPLTDTVSIVPEILSWRDVLPLGLTPDMSLQSCFAIMCRLETPQHIAESLYPKLCKAAPTRKSPSWIDASTDEVFKGFKGIVQHQTAARSRMESTSCPEPMFDIYECYVDDRRINETGQPITIDGGEDGLIVVPSYYDSSGNITQIEDGFEEQSDGIDMSDPANPKPLTQRIPRYRPITRQECRLYPNQRFISFVRQEGTTILLEDRRNHLWGKKRPITRAAFKMRPQQFIGFAPLHVAIKVIRDANRLLRSNSDSIVAKLFNLIGLDSGIAEDIRNDIKAKFNLRQAVRNFVEYPMRMLRDKPVQPLIDPKLYDVDPISMELAGLLLEQAEYLTSVVDLGALRRNAQIPSDDTQQKMFELLGSIIMDYSRNLESTIQDIGDIWLPMFLQYTSTPQIIRIAGADGVTQLMDFDPTSLVPLTTPGDKRSRAERAREMLSRIYFYVIPDSLHDMNSMTRKLELFQLQKAGAAISGEDLYLAMRPEATDYKELRKRWMDEQKENLLFATQIRQEIQAIAQFAGLMSVDDLNKVMTGDANRDVGRKPSFTGAAQLEKKEDENGVPRTTITST